MLREITSAEAVTIEERATFYELMRPIVYTARGLAGEGLVPVEDGDTIRIPEGYSATVVYAKNE